MKILKIFNILFLVPVILFVGTLLMSLFFGCTISGSDMIVRCNLRAIEPIITLLFPIMSFLKFSGIIWFTPALIIAIISFKKDFNEIKINNLPLKLLFKRISLYSTLIFLLLFISVFLPLLFFLIRLIGSL